MIGVRIDGEEIWLEPEEWKRWVEDGRIPPRALVFEKDRGWIPAADSAHYRPAPAGKAPARTPSAPGLREVLFPRKSISATEALLLVNILVFAVLVLQLGSGYLIQVRQWTGEWWHAVGDDHAYWWWIATIFMHAGPGHLSRNMISLLGGAGAVEYLMGRRWAFVVYFATGIGGMVLSYLGHDRPTLSIGASGAVFGFAGCLVTFIIRRYGMFTYRQKWKARRVYVPALVALFLPSVVYADYLGHAGGMITGFLLGLFIPPHPRLRELSESENDATA